MMMRRGGRRRRYVTREEAAVWCPSGRWGPKRTRVTQCWAVMTAEAIYTALMRDDLAKMRPGARGSALWSPGGRSDEIQWELRANAVWRFGRLFLICPRCHRRATRIYVPIETSWPACRRCWGLTYESRQRENYKDSGRFSGLGLTLRSLAESQTYSRRERRGVPSI